MSLFTYLTPSLFFGISWVLMLFIGSTMIARLKSIKGMKWSPREDTPDSHLAKAGTPSMGGIGLIGSALVGLVLAASVCELLRLFKIAPFNTVFTRWFWVFLAFPVVVLLHAALGFADDWSKARGRGGLTSKQKLLGQIVLALLFLIAVLTTSRSLGFQTGLESVGVFVLSTLIIIGTSNAVNLTDGIDGLAAGLSVQVALSFLLIKQGIPGYDASTQLLWFCLGGACLGFLAFNKYPAKVFMGDTGSLALGAALGAGAILTKSVALLPFIGFIFYVEMFSVIFQVLYFKYTKKKFGEGKRIFRRAPLHHHFELGGWSEWRVVGTFWLVNLCTSILGLVLWKMRVLPRFP